MARCAAALVAVLSAGALALAGCTGPAAVETGAGAAAGQVADDGSSTTWRRGERPAAPAVTGELLDGRPFDLADLRGKVVVLNFWGSWCAPCRAEAPALQAVHTATKASGVQFVGVNVRDSRDKATAFERKFGITYPSLFDDSGRVALRFRDTPPSRVPATILLDRQGRVAAVYRTPLLQEDLQPVVERLAAEPR